MDLNELIIYSRLIPERKAIYESYPDDLCEELKVYLKKKGIKKLYCHQAEMFEKAEEGKNLVITTSTASGKTLSFLLPVINRILKNPMTRAIFIYPTKALASDQYRAIKPFIDYFGKERISAGVYDGDTSSTERSRIRKDAHIILTNPDMLNGAFLPNHSRYGFDFLFSNLAYVVVDELHTYRGVFGSHVANVFRRLNRTCRYYKANPQYLCSTATIANPLELASDICGREFERISRDGSPAAERNYYLVQPPKIENNKSEFQGQKQATMVAAEMIPDFVEKHQSFITFAKSRRNVEVILRESRDKLKDESIFGHSLADKIDGYRGGYTPKQRKEIEKKMIKGEIYGLISTNALELGIDIGQVDTTILAGYPGTRASFWQQTGRAGRSGRACKNFMILESLPQDQYIGVNPRWLFDMESENAVIDKNNLLIELAHIRAAAAELPLTLDDISVFPDLGETIPVLLRLEELKSHNGRFLWCGNAFPAGDYSLRNMDEKRYKVMNRQAHTMITEMDETQAFREVHEGAIYMHDGEQYQVLKLDLESRTATVIPFEGNYYTMPGGNTEIRIIKELDKKSYQRTKVSWGDINVNDIVYMYKKLQFHNHQNMGYEMLPEPLSKDYNTESAWIRMPESVVKTYRSLLQPDSQGNLTRNNHFDGLCHCLKYATMMVTMTEKEDVGAYMSSNAIGMSDYNMDEVYLFIYDKIVGGLGYSEKAYEQISDIIDQAKIMVSGCSCKDGCAACVGDYKLSKKVVLWGLNSLSEELPAPEGYKYVPYAERPVHQKAFVFSELPGRWEAFAAYVKNTGDVYGTFLTSIKQVEVDKHTIVLHTESEFYKDWILDPMNITGLKNILRFHTDAPSNVVVKVSADGQNEGERRQRLTDKLRRMDRQAHGEKTDGYYS